MKVNSIWISMETIWDLRTFISIYIIVGCVASPPVMGDSNVATTEDPSIETTSPDPFPRLVPKENELKKLIIIPQGEVYREKIDPNHYFKWTDGANRKFAVYMASGIEKANLTIFESIYFDEENQTIWALPMSDNSGINHYYLMARGPGDNITSVPFEVLVIPNKNNPNHKILLHFEYNYILFEAYLPFRLEFLRMLSQVMGDGGDTANLTLDSYENTTSNGVSKMLVRISNETVGYAPCNASQMETIMKSYQTLSSGNDSRPWDYVRETFGSYNLVKVELELIGPCVKQAMSEEKSYWSKTLIPIAVGVLVIIVAAVSVVLYRRRKSRGGRPGVGGPGSKSSKLSSEPANFGVKSKHVPIIFADEIDEYSTNQISAVAPLIMKDEKPPAEFTKTPISSMNNTPINGPSNLSCSYDEFSPNGSSYHCNSFPSGGGDSILRAPSGSITTHRYAPSHYRPPPPYKPPSKAIIPS